MNTYYIIFFYYFLYLYGRNIPLPLIIIFFILSLFSNIIIEKFDLFSDKIDQTISITNDISINNDQLCIDDVCINNDQFNKIIDNNFSKNNHFCIDNVCINKDHLKILQSGDIFIVNKDNLPIINDNKNIKLHDKSFQEDRNNNNIRWRLIY